jgi:2OG-Fe(II) oxygenase superfamily
VETLRSEGLQNAETIAQAPFPLLLGNGILDPAAAPELDHDFPHYRGAGFFPHDKADCGPALNTLIDELTSPAFADAIGQRLGIERLSQFPVLVTLCRSLNRRHGTIHTDSRSKVASLLLYLNPEWPEGSAGCLRFLYRGDDIDATVAPELRPLYGAFTAFKRTENSFHGHLPFEGERRVVQIAWLRDTEALERKRQRGRLSRAVKWMAGSVDRWFGHRRDRNAAHRD